jgi:hypothetical protein
LAREIVADDAAQGVRSHQRATAHRIGLLFAQRLRALAPDRPKAATAAGGNALILLDRQIALKNELYPSLSTTRGGKFSVTGAAIAAANSISLAGQMRGTARMALR